MAVKNDNLHRIVATNATALETELDDKMLGLDGEKFNIGFKDSSGNMHWFVPKGGNAQFQDLVIGDLVGTTDRLVMVTPEGEIVESTISSGGVGQQDLSSVLGFGNIALTYIQLKSHTDTQKVLHLDGEKIVVFDNGDVGNFFTAEVNKTGLKVLTHAETTDSDKYVEVNSSEIMFVSDFIPGGYAGIASYNVGGMNCLEIGRAYSKDSDDSWIDIIGGRAYITRAYADAHYTGGATVDNSNYIDFGLQGYFAADTFLAYGTNANAGTDQITQFVGMNSRKVVALSWILNRHTTTPFDIRISRSGEDLETIVSATTSDIGYSILANPLVVMPGQTLEISFSVSIDISASVTIELS